MDEQDEKKESAHCVKTLLAAGASTVLAFIIGFGCADTPVTSYGQPALLVLAVPAAAFGVVARRLYLGALFSPLFALAGAIGLLRRCAPPDSASPIALGFFFGLGGLVCVVAGAVGGLIGDLARQRP